MRYIKPAKGPITSFMDIGRMHPKAGKILPHQGVDIGSASDNRIVAAAHGVVHETGWGRIPGNYILIRHPDGEFTNYSHLSSFAVSRGNSVKQGQVIGMKGATGSATGVHLHFEISKGSYNQSFSNKKNPLLQFKDPDTLLMQQMYQKLGYKIKADGYYGEEMIDITATYQKDRGLIVDGYAGNGVMAALKKDTAKQVATAKPVPKPKEEISMSESYFKPDSKALRDEMVLMLKEAHKRGYLSRDWSIEAAANKLTMEQAVGLQSTIIRRVVMGGE